MSKPAVLLLVEDNEGDIELTRIAFEKVGSDCQLDFVYDGAQALEYLLQRGEYKYASRPDLILLDLNMPAMGGKDFLTIVKEDREFKSIPVIVFTSSNSTRDVEDSYRLHANAYIIKPFRMEEYVDVAKQVESFWLNLSQLPGQMAG
jgi:CheY-like chemotaxis protein